MTEMLRVLIEVNGVAVVDSDMVVHRVNVEVQHGTRIKLAPASPWLEHELSGEHSICIDYTDPTGELMAPMSTLEKNVQPV